MSLAGLGARSVTGLDFSPSAIAAATGLSARAETHVGFVESDVYHAATVLGAGCCDLVYTGTDEGHDGSSVTPLSPVVGAAVDAAAIDTDRLRAALVDGKNSGESVELPLAVGMASAFDLRFCTAGAAVRYPRLIGP